MRSPTKIVRLFPVFLLLAAGNAGAAEIKVLVSGAFTAAFKELVPKFEHATGIKVVAETGVPSVASTPGSIPDRLQKGELVDVVILSSSGIEGLIKEGRVLADSRVDLVRSSIGVAVRAGSPKPDIRSVAALKQTLLAAKSIAYSSSISGVYVSTELYERLGIADQVMGKSKKVAGMVGDAVARGEAELGIQQISELLPVKGIVYVGPLPREVQRVSVFSAGIAVTSKERTSASALIKFFSGVSARAAIVKSGLEPIKSP